MKTGEHKDEFVAEARRVKESCENVAFQIKRAREFGLEGCQLAFFGLQSASRWLGFMDADFSVIRDDDPDRDAMYNRLKKEVARVDRARELFMTKCSRGTTLPRRRRR